MRVQSIPVVGEDGKSQETITPFIPEFEALTTNNRMEMTAVIRGLECLKRPTSVELLTDSVYVGKGFSEWLPKWKANGWRRREGSRWAEGKNEDLWRQLDALGRPVGPLLPDRVRIARQRLHVRRLHIRDGQHLAAATQASGRGCGRTPAIGLLAGQ